MKQLNKKMMKVLGFVAIVAAVGVLGTTNSVQAKQLKENKVYKINLDGKKGKEKVQIKTKQDKKREDFVIYSMYINGKKVAKQKGFELRCKTMDIDKKSKGTALVFYAQTDSHCLSNKAGIFSYKDGKLKRLINFNKSFGEMSIYRLDKISTNGKGFVTIEADTPCRVNIGSFFAKIIFQLKSGKLVKVTNGSFVLNKFSRKYQYVLKENVKVYDNEECTGEEQLIFKKNMKIQILKVSYKTTTVDGRKEVSAANAYVKASNGSYGWINIRQVEYDDLDVEHQQFKEYPMWG